MAWSERSEPSALDPRGLRGPHDLLDPTLCPDRVEATGSGRRSSRIAPLRRVTLGPRPGGRRPLRPLECPAPQSPAVPTPPPADTRRDSGQSRPWYQWSDSRVRSGCRTARTPVCRCVPEPAPLTLSGPGKAMISLPGPPATSLLRVLFLGLTTLGE